MGGVSSREEEMIDRMWGRPTRSRSPSPGPSGDSSSSLTKKSPSSNQEDDSIVHETDAELGDEEEGVELEPFNPDDYDAKKYGPILPNGEINWECPCLGGAAHGPCATEFRAAFSCFHYRYEN